MNWKDLPFIYQVRMNVGHGKLPLLTEMPSVGDWIVANQCIQRVTAVTPQTFVLNGDRFRMRGREWCTGTKFSVHYAHVPTAAMIQAAEAKELEAFLKYEAHLAKCEEARRKVLAFDMSKVSLDQFRCIAEILMLEIDGRA